MWFRLSGNGASNAGNDGASVMSNNNDNNTNSNSNNEPSKFEKFRRASFRRKSNGPVAPPRKRSKSPHALLQKSKTPTVLEAFEDEVTNSLKPATANLKKYKNEVSITLGEQDSGVLDDYGHSTVSALLLPSSEPSSNKANCAKKAVLKPIKTEPPKRKFCKGPPPPPTTTTTTTTTKTITKGITTRQQHSQDGAVKLPSQKAIDNEHAKKVLAGVDTDDEDIDSDSDTDSYSDNDKGGSCKAIESNIDDIPQRGKEKILLTDPKYKRNRIEKSSSKTKVVDLEKRESIKRSRSARKISAPPVLMDDKSQQVVGSKKSKKEKEKEIANAAKKQTRAHSNLNLQALVKFVVSNKKFITSDDGFTLMRRKSISEAASSVFAVAATCKPLPIALKYGQDGVVADSPKELDAKTERNVVLVKQQKLKNSFCERSNSSEQSLTTPSEEKSLLPPLIKEKARKWSKAGKKSSTIKVQRNGSSSSKSSGNFEDEAFYSFDEIDKAETHTCNGPLDEVTELKRKSSSPSLTSRVAAKINETTNNYKNRKAKKRKTTAAGKRPELYKQISVERLHATSIVRQPSDRRPDASGSITASSRPNGNAAHNSSDLQTSFHARSASGDGSSADGTQIIASIGTAATALGATVVGGDTSAQDAAAGNVGGDSKDSRRERLHHQHQQNKSAPVSVNRSESYKERLSHKRNRNSRRKTSDPSLTSRPNDDQTEAGLSNSNYTASSNSSLSSGGSESPSTSIEQVSGTATTASGATTVHHHHGGSMHQHGPHHIHQHSHQDSFHGSLGGSSSSASFWGGSIGGAGGPTIGQLTRQWNFESDDDDDLNEADWSSNVAANILAALTDAEKKRQEIINEIYQTERSHVRTLKLLERLFFCPLQESGVLSNDHLRLLFPPALLSLRELHTAFESRLKQRRIEHNHVVSHVGDLLASMFDGPAGDELREYAAQFCARQQIALEALKEKRRKDEQLQKLLSKAESHKACRRLQLKDLLPTVLQRLTKYPLLFENLYKVTIRVVPENTTEADAIQRALESSKKILVDVNQAVKTAEDAHKLQNIQRKLDKSFDKDEYKNLDLTQYRLIHDGSLTMKKNPSIQLHGLLFENMIVLLTKQDDKYSLKYLHAARNTEVNNKPVSPIMNIDSETLVRQEAADKNSFFLIKTKTSQMLELRAPSSSECKTGMRRKSLCNGALLTLSSQNGKTGTSTTDSTNSTPSKSKKERRRGSFNEASANSSGRRASLVSRWFKHISDAAEQYKPRSKNANHEPVDDPAIATLPHSNTRESLELTPERPPPISATATVTTTPLAPMMPPPIVHTPQVNNNNYDGGIQMRNGRRESTPTSSNISGGDGPAYQNLQHRQHLSQYELSPAVNRTMSTRSCGEANNNYGTDNISTINGVTLRHTQSARQASGPDAAADGLANTQSGSSKRDSASIVYSNNSNNTRTLMQSSPPLVEPTAIQISISPAHTAEPVLTPSERLRRLDAAIREGLLEKQKIICDMFRLPVEHFHEIVDIAAMPEAPKDSADIALAAYAQVQSLTEVLNDYMHVTPEQEISAVSTAVCDQCHEKQRHNQQLHQHQQQGGLSTSTSSSSGVSAVTQIHSVEQTPPPLPPPNKTPIPQTAQQQTPAPTAAKLQTPIAALDEVNIHEDDDGYCEIDELRLPALPPHITATAKSASPPPPPLPPPAGSFKNPPPPPLPAQTQTQTTKAATAVAISPTPELIKRQSTISSDSIPEESADELTQAAMDDNKVKVEADTEEVNSSSKEETNEHETIQKLVGTVEEDQPRQETESNDQAKPSTTNKQTGHNSETETTDATETKPSSDNKDNDKTTIESNSNEQTAINDALSTLNKLSAAISTVDRTTQTMPLINSNVGTNSTNINGGLTSPLCGPNRIQHANSLEPSIPCHALNSIVSALNAQISLLLPKINERDTERERLRKENQHLRELLNAMHERQRVENKMETPKDNNAAVQKDADINDESDCTNNRKTSDKHDTPKITTTESTTSTTNTKMLKAEKIEN